jgi:hypothetical protein
MTAWWKVTGGKHWILAGALAAGSVSADGIRIDRDDPAREVIEELLGAERSPLLAARADDPAAPKVALGMSKDAKAASKPASKSVDAKPADPKGALPKGNSVPAKPAPVKPDAAPTAKPIDADPTARISAPAEKKMSPAPVAKPTEVAKPSEPAKAPPKVEPAKAEPAKSAAPAPAPKSDPAKADVKPASKDGPRLNDLPPAPKPVASATNPPPPPTPVGAKEGAMPAPASVAPASKDVGSILNELVDRDPTLRVMPPTKAPPTRRPGAVDRIIDDTARSEPAKPAGPAEAKVLFDQAKQAEKDGRLADAARLAGAARRLAPGETAIASYADAVAKAANAVKVKRSTNIRAKAHLAAALTRGQELVQERRFDEAADILTGVVEGATLFPATDDVSMYVRIAKNELNNPKLAGLDAGAAGSAAAVVRNPIDDVKLVDPGYAPPENARRLLRASESAVPAWYSIQKVKLVTSMSVDYQKTSVARILDDLSAKTGIQFVIDTPVAMTRAHQNTFIDLRAGEVPAETLLNLVCVKTGVEYVIMERSVVITTPARALAAVKDMPGLLRHNWAVTRVLFPELDPDLVAVRPKPANMPGPGTVTRPRAEEDLPPWLANRSALLDHLRQLLR